jgi:Ca2+-binding RTX toxin-like protein
LRHIFSVLAVAVLMADALIATVGSALAQEDPQPPPGPTVTVTFVLAVAGQPPPEATFWGYLTFEPFGIRLTESDGDEIYTGSFANFPQGDAQPFWIVQGTGTRFSQVFGEQAGEPITLLKDFGVWTISQDTTLPVAISFLEGRYIVGTPWDDRLLGENGPDLIEGLGGHDAISGAYGDDLIYGGPDDDAIYGGSGDDLIAGLSLSDLIYGGYGDDLIRGGALDDALYGGPGSDAIYGDELQTEAFDDYLYSAGDGTADLVSGGAGSDLCIVGPEDLPYTYGCEMLYVQ